MILRDKPGVWELLLATRGSIILKILPQLAVVSGFALLVMLADRYWRPLTHTNIAPFTVFGIALSLFLGFRNNAAYDRWWEARRLWGQLIADMRALGRETDLFLTGRERRQRVLRLALAFMHRHRTNLRRISDDRASGWVADLPEGPHPPCTALDAIGVELTQAAREGTLDGYGQRALAQRLAAISYAQAGCERLANTPLPYVYSLLIFRTIWLYCLLVPFGLIDTAGWLTPVFAGVVAYVFFGLAEVTEELGHPFGSTPNCLPLDAMCRTVEISLAPHLGITPPEPVKPVDFLLT
jgi:putative membrane protein